jgi:hypothetical protein
MLLAMVVREVDGKVVELALEGAIAERAVLVELVGVPALATDNLVTRHALIITIRRQAGEQEGMMV